MRIEFRKLRFVSRSVLALAISISMAVGSVAAQDATTAQVPKAAAKPDVTQQLKGTLDDKDNPLLIGKRDLNKGQIQFYSLDKEVALGRQLAAEIDRSSKFIDDPLVGEYINRVAQNLVLNSDAKVPFTIKVIDSNEVNAFALPGGFLYIHRGVLELADNEAEMAGVIAHEIAHVTARHGVEQASKGTLVNYASIPLIFVGGWGGYIAQQVAALAIPLGFLKFSRGAEKEADRLGAQYMWASGYDPQALITFFEKLQAKEKKKPGTLAKIFMSHPMTGDRVKEVQSLVSLFPERGEYQLSSSEFTQIKSRTLAMTATRSSSTDNSGRPTLKRKPTSQSDDTGDTSSQPSERPTLKRKPDSSSTSTGTSTESSEPTESSERPTLKRTEKTPEAEKPAAEPESSERPTLKKKPVDN